MTRIRISHLNESKPGHVRGHVSAKLSVSLKLMLTELNKIKGNENYKSTTNPKNIIFMKLI